MKPVRHFIRDFKDWEELWCFNTLEILSNAGYYHYQYNEGTEYNDYIACYSWCSENLPKEDFAFLNTYLFLQVKI
jgi:hypothetical protein